MIKKLTNLKTIPLKSVAKNQIYWAENEDTLRKKKDETWTKQYTQLDQAKDRRWSAYEENYWIIDKVEGLELYITNAGNTFQKKIIKHDDNSFFYMGKLPTAGQFYDVRTDEDASREPVKIFYTYLKSFSNNDKKPYRIKYYLGMYKGRAEEPHRWAHPEHNSIGVSIHTWFNMDPILIVDTKLKGLYNSLHTNSEYSDNLKYNFRF